MKDFVHAPNKIKARDDAQVQVATNLHRASQPVPALKKTTYHPHHQQDYVVFWTL